MTPYLLMIMVHPVPFLASFHAKMNTDQTTIIPSAREHRYFMLARKSAAKSLYFRKSNGRISIGAVIVRGNYVVSMGVNKRKTHPTQFIHNHATCRVAPQPNIHAEVDALVSSRRHDLYGAEIFVYREATNGSLANCRPCAACMNALILAGVKHLYYTTTQGFHYKRIRNGA